MGLRAALCVPFVALGVYGQPAFEVASVKASHPSEARATRYGCRGGPGTGDLARWECSAMPLSGLITLAYDIERFQLLTPPSMDWIHQQFDIVAKVPEGTTKDALRLMEQRLLAERFDLKVHRDQKDMAVYELTVGKGGLKAKKSALHGPGVAREAGVAPPHSHIGEDGYPTVPPGWSGTVIMRDRKMLGAPNCSMAGLATLLSVQAERPVVDGTGVTGTYDIVLRWFLDTTPGSDSSPTGPTLMDAVREQLGLVLVPKRRAIDVIVVDHLNRAPTEN